MIYVGRWSILVTIALIVFSVLWALPNALPANVRESFPGWLPNRTMSLGLDLRGGSYLLYEVDLEAVNRDRLETLRADIRNELRRARINYTGLEFRGGALTLRIMNPADTERARTAINTLANPGGTTALFGVANTQQYQIAAAADGEITIRMDEAYLRNLRTQTISQSIEVIRRRIDALGTQETSIVPQGTERILIQAPGVTDPEQLKRIVGTTAQMTFRLVDENGDIQAALQGRVPIEDELLYEPGPTPDSPEQPILVQRRVMVAGERLVQASQSFDGQTNEPVVSFRFDTRGAREFGDVTRSNVGRRFAIVLDNKVISAPVILGPILGGTGQIQGQFTIQTANDLAVLLNAGALPAPLTVIEERTVGAELGADSVSAGAIAAVLGLVAVLVFMLLSYGLFGVFAAIGLLVNMVLLIAVLTFLTATLTLPGIAGMVLTMGMAVDANVLIYERIREEMHGGKTLVAAIDTGFRKAMSAIIDSNLTTILAGVILFQLGSGPVRGFAVTLVLGILTSFFSAIMVTRLIVILWLRSRKPKALTL
jgi:protein-export membrane protein SecD